MKFLQFAAVLAVSAIAASHALAGEIVNIDGTSSVGSTVSLAAGTYDVTFAGIAGGGTYDGYSLATNNGTPVQFTDQLAISLGGTTNFNTSATYDLFQGGQQAGFSTAAAALAAYQSALANGTLSYSASYANQNYTSTVDEITFTLATAGLVTFTAPDQYYPDNTGGVSIMLQQAAIPEPASYALFGAGLLGLTLMLRRRAKA